MTSSLPNVRQSIDFCAVSIESKQSHKYLSIIKMLLVIALCAGQVYFVTLFFTTGQKQRVRPQK